MKKILALILALVMLFALTLTGCGGNPGGTETGNGGEGGGAAAGTDVTLRFSTHDPETSAIMMATQDYFDQITEATDGHVKVEMLASAVVASAANVGDMVSGRGVDMGWIYTSYYPTQFTLSDVITLPLQGFGDEIAATQMLWDLYETVPELAAQWDNEYKVLQLYANPPMIIATSDRVSSVEDLHGLTLRCPSGAITDVLAGWGAAGNSMGPNDIYEAMEKGNIDGYIFETVGMTTFSLQEVTNYYLDLPLYTGPFAVAMNWDSWNELPAEYQEAIDAISGREASLASAQAFVDAMNDAVAEIKASNGSNGQPGEFITPTEDEIAGLKVAADEYAAKWCESITASTGVDGAEFLALAQETIAQYE